MKSAFQPVMSGQVRCRSMRLLFACGHGHAPSHVTLARRPGGARAGQCPVWRLRSWAYRDAMRRSRLRAARAGLGVKKALLEALAGESESDSDAARHPCAYLAQTYSATLVPPGFHHVRRSPTQRPAGSPMLSKGHKRPLVPIARFCAKPLSWGSCSCVRMAWLVRSAVSTLRRSHAGTV